MLWILYFLVCHDMETLSALLALCEGNPLVTIGFHSQRASNANLWCFFNVDLNKLEQTVERLVIWDAMTLMWCHCKDTDKKEKHVAGNTVYFVHMDALAVWLSVNFLYIFQGFFTILLTLKHQETHGCVVSIVATDDLVLKHQAISIHNAD